jgi:hypothetical protein
MVPEWKGAADVATHAAGSSARRVAGVGALLLFLAGGYWRVSLTYPPNSDYSFGLLLAQSFIGGNYLLRGWWFPLMSSYGTDLPLYALAEAVAGFRPVLLRIVPAIVYALVVLFALLLSRRQNHSSSLSVGLALTFVFIAFPYSYDQIFWLLAPEDHVVPLLWVLIAFFSASEVERRGWPMQLVTFLFLTLAAIGDRIAWFIGTLPLLVVSIIRLAANRNSNVRADVTLAVNAGMSLAVSALVLELFQLSGIWTMWDADTSLVPLHSLGHKLALTVDCILSVFGANVFHRHASRAVSVVAAFHLIGPALVSFALYREIEAWRTRHERNDRVSELLVAAIVSVLAAFVFSNIPQDRGAGRYLTSVLVFGAILVGRVSSAEMNSHRRISWAVVALGSIYVATFAPRLFFARSTDDVWNPVATVLHEHGLRDGYASFPFATSVTVSSRELVIIRPVIREGGKLAPFRGMTHMGWYSSANPLFKPDFLLIDEFEAYGVSAGTAEATFGKPSRTFSFKISDIEVSFRVMVWEKNLAADLNTSSRDPRLGTEPIPTARPPG